MARNKHIGSKLDEFLREEGLLAQARAVAIKRVIAWQEARDTEGYARKPAVKGEFDVWEKEQDWGPR